MPSFNVTKKMGTRGLHNSEMKRLVSVLHAGVSKEEIKCLPRNLRSSLLSSSGSSNLCSLHKELDATLIKDVWSWIRYEFQSGIGRHVFPVIMAGKLTEAQERKIRQLEPVLQMWRTDFKTELSAPLGHEPIVAGSTWTYQQDRCLACMLSRIGSDTDVLCALYAGMIARFPTHKLSSRKLILAELGVSQLGDPKSKRVRFVRYWIKASTKGDTALFEAVELGIVIKQQYKEFKHEMRSGTPSVCCRTSMEGVSTRSSLDLFHDGHQPSTRTERLLVPDHRPSQQTSSREPSVHHCSTQYVSRSHTTDPKLGPRPRSPSLDLHTPLGKVGFRHAGHNVRDSSDSARPLLNRESSSSASTINPSDSISAFLTGERVYTAHPHNPPSSPAIVNLGAFHGRSVPSEPRTVYAEHTRSFGPSAIPAPLTPRKAFYTSVADSYTTILSYDNGPTDQQGTWNHPTSDVPRPQSFSVYGAFGGTEEDPFEAADEEEGEGLGMESRSSTKWGELY